MVVIRLQFDDDARKFQLLSWVPEVWTPWWRWLWRMYDVTVCSKAGQLPRLFIRVKFIVYLTWWW